MGERHEHSIAFRQFLALPPSLAKSSMIATRSTIPLALDGDDKTACSMAAMSNFGALLTAGATLNETF